MPLYRNSVLSETTSLGIWKIEETPDVLLDTIHLGKDEKLYYDSLRSDLRKKHWLSYRNILFSLMQDPVELVYDEFGKPHPVNRKFHLSVSHSGIFSAAIISTDTPVGIDIEMVKERVERVKEKFLSEEETGSIGNQDVLEKLYVYWGSKESLYKLYGRPEIGFQKDIFVYPFFYTASGTGECFARLTTHEGIRDFRIFYEKIGDYMLVYSTGEKNPEQKSSGK